MKCLAAPGEEAGFRQHNGVLLRAGGKVAGPVGWEALVGGEWGEVGRVDDERVGERIGGRGKEQKRIGSVGAATAAQKGMRRGKVWNGGVCTARAGKAEELPREVATQRWDRNIPDIVVAVVFRTGRREDTN